jgi:hypothetical protein
MKNIQEEDDKENFDNKVINNLATEKVFLNDKLVSSNNKEIDGMMKEYKDKNKMRRNFYQKKPLNK